MLTVGDSFPQFSCQACIGTGKDDMKRLTNADYTGKWVVYFFYPKDFTFVCPTELAEFHKQLKAFADRDTSVVGGSTDNDSAFWRRRRATACGPRSSSIRMALFSGSTSTRAAWAAMSPRCSACSTRCRATNSAHATGRRATRT